MTCEELKEVYELYALGVLDGEEREEMEAHLARGCEACKAGVHRAVAMNSAMMGLVPAAEPPRRLKKRVMASIGARSVNWGWAAALAAVAMLVLVVFTNYQKNRAELELAQTRGELMQVAGDRDRAAKDRDDAMKAIQFLNMPETREVGFGKDKPVGGNIFVNPKGVMLIATNLPALPAGKMFEMWVIPKKTGKPMPAGMFKAMESGTAYNVMPGVWDLAPGDLIAVTIEPEAGSSAPTTTPLFAAPV